MTIVDAIRERAAAQPRAVALAIQGKDAPTRYLDYGSLVERVAGHAADLRAAGIGSGERCGLVARNGPDFIAWALALLDAGACLVPIADDQSGPALADFAARAHLHHLLVEAEGFAPRACPAPAPVDGAGDADFRALRPAYLRFTSGTTSERKGVILGHDAILARLAAANRGLAIGPGDRVLWLLPMAHHFVVSILLYLRYGASILLPHGHLAAPVLRLAADEGATVLYASPFHMNLFSKDAGDVGLPDLRLAISTAEGLRVAVAERFAARFGHPVSQALGIIEVGLPVLNRARPGEKPGALGVPLPDYDVWLRDEDGGRLEGPGSPDRTGEICIRGPGLFDAYMAPWTPAARILEPDGFRTGDQGYFDADGDLHMAGRRHNRINMAGMKFFCEEVEHVLDEHPAVECSRVRAREHPHLGDIPMAEIVPADADAPPSAAELTRYCRDRLAGYKIPRRFEIVEALPTTATGKVQRAD